MRLIRPTIFILIWFPLFAMPAGAATQAYFSSQESVEAEVVRLLDRSRSSIDIALFELRSPRLARAIREAQGRGVNVRLILDASHRQDDLPTGEVRWLGGKNNGGRGVMHHKFALFDREAVITGSFNWTPGAEHANYENALLIDDSNTVQDYAREFESLWQRAQEGPLPDDKPKNEGAQRHHQKSRASSKQKSLKKVKIKIQKPPKKHKPKTHTI